MFRLAGRSWPAGDPGSQSFLRIVSPQGFEPGKSLLARSPGGYVLAPFQFVAFSLEATEQVLQIGAAGQKPVDGGAELRLVAGAALFRLMLNVALALVLAGDNDGQAMLFADTVAGAADLMVASLVGVVVPVVLETDRIEDPVIISMVLVNVKGVDILASAGTLGFGSLKICVRVKSTDAPVDRIVLDQLGGVMKNFGAEYGLLVSWSGFKSSVINEMAKQFFEIRLWTHKEIIEEFLRYYDQMDDEIKELIPLKKIWVVSNDDQ